MKMTSLRLIVLETNVANDDAQEESQSDTGTLITNKLKLRANDGISFVDGEGRHIADKITSRGEKSTGKYVKWYNVEYSVLSLPKSM